MPARGQVEPRSLEDWAAEARRVERIRLATEIESKHSEEWRVMVARLSEGLRMLLTVDPALDAEAVRVARARLADPTP